MITWVISICAHYSVDLMICFNHFVYLICHQLLSETFFFLLTGDGVSVAKEEATYIQGTKVIRSNQFIYSILQFTSDLSSSGIAIKSVSSAT